MASTAQRAVRLSAAMKLLADELAASGESLPVKTGDSQIDTANMMVLVAGIMKRQRQELATALSGDDGDDGKSTRKSPSKAKSS